MMDMGVIPMPLSAQEFKAYADQERAAWADVIKGRHQARMSAPA